MSNLIPLNVRVNCQGCGQEFMTGDPYRYKFCPAVWCMPLEIAYLREEVWRLEAERSLSDDHYMAALTIATEQYNYEEANSSIEAGCSPDPVTPDHWLKMATERQVWKEPQSGKEYIIGVDPAHGPDMTVFGSIPVKVDESLPDGVAQFRDDQGKVLLEVRNIGGDDDRRRQVIKDEYDKTEIV